MAKKKLKRFDGDVIERLLVTVYESGREKKTKLARNANLSYDRCVSYLECLESLDFVKKHNDGKHDVYDLTANGISLCKRKLSDSFEKSESNNFLLLV